MNGWAEFVLIIIVSVAAILAVASSIWEWRRRDDLQNSLQNQIDRLTTLGGSTAEEDLLRADIEEMKEELSKLRAEVLQLTAVVSILTTQLKAANIEPAIDLGNSINGDDVPLVSMSSIRRKMIRYFTQEGLNSIMFNMGIDDQAIEAGTKTQRVEDILDYVVQRGRLHDLIKTLQEERPKVDWY